MLINSNLKVSEEIAECLYLLSFINQNNMIFTGGSRMKSSVIEMNTKIRLSIVLIMPILISESVSICIPGNKFSIGDYCVSAIKARV